MSSSMNSLCSLDLTSLPLTGCQHVLTSVTALLDFISDIYSNGHAILAITTLVLCIHSFYHVQKLLTNGIGRASDGANISPGHFFSIGLHALIFIYAIVFLIGFGLETVGSFTPAQFLSGIADVVTYNLIWITGFVHFFQKSSVIKGRCYIYTCFWIGSFLPTVMYLVVLALFEWSSIGDQLVRGLFIWIMAFRGVIGVAILLHIYLSTGFKIAELGYVGQGRSRAQQYFSFWISVLNIVQGVLGCVCALTPICTVNGILPMVFKWISFWYLVMFALLMTYLIIGDVEYAHYRSWENGIFTQICRSYERRYYTSSCWSSLMMWYFRPPRRKTLPAMGETFSNITVSPATPHLNNVDQQLLMISYSTSKLKSLVIWGAHAAGFLVAGLCLMNLLILQGIEHGLITGNIVSFIIVVVSQIMFRIFRAGTGGFTDQGNRMNIILTMVVLLICIIPHFCGLGVSYLFGCSYWIMGAFIIAISSLENRDEDELDQLVQNLAATTDTRFNVTKSHFNSSYQPSHSIFNRHNGILRISSQVLWQTKQATPFEILWRFFLLRTCATTIVLQCLMMAYYEFYLPVALGLSMFLIPKGLRLLAKGENTIQGLAKICICQAGLVVLGVAIGILLPIINGSRDGGIGIFKIYDSINSTANFNSTNGIFVPPNWAIQNITNTSSSAAILSSNNELLFMPESTFSPSSILSASILSTICVNKTSTISSSVVFVNDNPWKSSFVPTNESALSAYYKLWGYKSTIAYATDNFEIVEANFAVLNSFSVLKSKNAGLMVLIKFHSVAEVQTILPIVSKLGIFGIIIENSVSELLDSSLVAIDSKFSWNLLNESTRQPFLTSTITMNNSGLILALLAVFLGAVLIVLAICLAFPSRKAMSSDLKTVSEKLIMAFRFLRSPLPLKPKTSDTPPIPDFTDMPTDEGSFNRYSFLTSDDLLKMWRILAACAAVGGAIYLGGLCTLYPSLSSAFPAAVLTLLTSFASIITLLFVFSMQQSNMIVLASYIFLQVTLHSFGRVLHAVACRDNALSTGGPAMALGGIIFCTVIISFHSRIIIQRKIPKLSDYYSVFDRNSVVSKSALALIFIGWAIFTAGVSIAMNQYYMTSTTKSLLLQAAIIGSLAWVGHVSTNCIDVNLERLWVNFGLSPLTIQRVFILIPHLLSFWSYAVIGAVMYLAGDASYMPDMILGNVRALLQVGGALYLIGSTGLFYHMLDAGIDYDFSAIMKLAKKGPSKQESDHTLAEDSGDVDSSDLSLHQFLLSCNWLQQVFKLCILAMTASILHILFTYSGLRSAWSFPGPLIFLPCSAVAIIGLLRWIILEKKDKNSYSMPVFYSAGLLAVASAGNVFFLTVGSSAVVSGCAELTSFSALFILSFSVLYSLSRTWADVRTMKLQTKSVQNSSAFLGLVTCIGSLVTFFFDGVAWTDSGRTAMRITLIVTYLFYFIAFVIKGRYGLSTMFRSGMYAILCCSVASAGSLCISSITDILANRGNSSALAAEFGLSIVFVGTFVVTSVKMFYYCSKITLSELEERTFISPETRTAEKMQTGEYMMGQPALKQLFQSITNGLAFRASAMLILAGLGLSLFGYANVAEIPSAFGFHIYLVNVLLTLALISTHIWLQWTFMQFAAAGTFVLTLVSSSIILDQSTMNANGTAQIATIIGVLFIDFGGMVLFIGIADLLHDQRCERKKEHKISLNRLKAGRYMLFIFITLLFGWLILGSGIISKGGFLGSACSTALAYLILTFPGFASSLFIALLIPGSISRGLSDILRSLYNKMLFMESLPSSNTDSSQPPALAEFPSRSFKLFTCLSTIFCCGTVINSGVQGTLMTSSNGWSALVIVGALLTLIGHASFLFLVAFYALPGEEMKQQVPTQKSPNSDVDIRMNDATDQPLTSTMPSSDADRLEPGANQIKVDHDKLKDTKEVKAKALSKGTRETLGLKNTDENDQGTSALTSDLPLDPISEDPVLEGELSQMLFGGSENAIGISDTLSVK